jgi:hypothetical protein
MQDAGKVALVLGTTFAAGIVAGWLLNAYTRKVGESPRFRPYFM